MDFVIVFNDTLVTLNEDIPNPAGDLYWLESTIGATKVTKSFRRSSFCQSKDIVCLTLALCFHMV